MAKNSVQNTIYMSVIIKMTTERMYEVICDNFNIVKMGSIGNYA
jgi:hypothetical protein